MESKLNNTNFYYFRMNNQLDKQGKESQDPHKQLDILETQMNAKILQMQDKHAKVSRLKLDG